MHKEIVEMGRILLRPVEESDYDLLHFWRNSDDYIRMVSADRSQIDFKQFATEQRKADRSEKQLHFLVVSRKGGVVIGRIYAFNINQVDGNAFINIYLIPDYRRRGYGPEAGVGLLSYLFSTFQLRKVYCDVLDYNSQSMSLVKNLGFVVEGNFREHSYFQGEWHNVTRLAIFKNQLDRIEWLKKLFLSKIKLS